MFQGMSEGQLERLFAQSRWDSTSTGRVRATSAFLAGLAQVLATGSKRDGDAKEVQIGYSSRSEIAKALWHDIELRIGLPSPHGSEMACPRPVDEKGVCASRALRRVRSDLTRLTTGLVHGLPAVARPASHRTDHESVELCCWTFECRTLLEEEGVNGQQHVPQSKRKEK
eukprot:5097868-Amphidinium_carterae.1